MLTPRSCPAVRSKDVSQGQGQGQWQGNGIARKEAAAHLEVVEEWQAEEAREGWNARENNDAAQNACRYLLWHLFVRGACIWLLFPFRITWKLLPWSCLLLWGHLLWLRRQTGGEIQFPRKKDSACMLLREAR